MTILAKLTNVDARPREKTKKKGFHPYRAIAEAAGSLRNYQDVPVRFQRQWISTFLTAVVVLGLVGGLYLNVTSRAAIVGREIQNLESQKITNERLNADLQTQIAGLLANSVLEERAKELGFVPVKRTDLEYLVVPGYFPQPAVDMASPAAETNVMTMSPEFSESLFDWISRQTESASTPLSQILDQP